MLATSFSASLRSGLSWCWTDGEIMTFELSVICIIGGFGDSLRIEYPRRRSVGENCCSVEHLRHSARCIELLHYDFLLSKELVDNERHPSIRQIEDDTMTSLVFSRRVAKAVTKTHSRHRHAANLQDFLPVFETNHLRAYHQRLDDVSDRQRIYLIVAASKHRMNDRQGHGKLETYLSSRACVG